MAFYWVPSGLHEKSFFKVQVYFKYGDYHFKPLNRITYKLERDSRGIVVRSWIKMPDREVVIVSDDKYKPMDCNYDECLPLNPFGFKSPLERYLRYAMISAFCAKSDPFFKDPRNNESRIKMIADSGGAQLRFGTANYIDPLDVAKFYNGMTDIGVSLDLPPRPIDWSHPTEITKIIKAMAVVQKKNNQIILDNTKQDFGFLNAVHSGPLPYQTRYWIEQVRDDDPREIGWAMGSNSKNHFNCLRAWMIALKEYPKKHMHIFGIAGFLRLPSMAWMARGGTIVTSDSTSYGVGVRKRKFLTTDLRGRVLPFTIGEENKEGPEGVRITNMGAIPCNCPMCSRMKHWAVYTLPAESRAPFLLSWHNMCVFANVSNTLDHLARTLSLDDYLLATTDMMSHIKNREVRRAITKNKDYKSTSMSKAEGMLAQIRYVDCVLKEGVDRANNEFGMFFESRGESAGFMKALPTLKKETKDKMQITDVEDPRLSELKETSDLPHAFLEKFLKKQKVSKKRKEGEEAENIDHMASIFANMDSNVRLVKRYIRPDVLRKEFGIENIPPYTGADFKLARERRNVKLTEGSLMLGTTKQELVFIEKFDDILPTETYEKAKEFIDLAMDNPAIIRVPSTKKKPIGTVVKKSPNILKRVATDLKLQTLLLKSIGVTDEESIEANLIVTAIQSGGTPDTTKLVEAGWDEDELDSLRHFALIPELTWRSFLIASRHYQRKYGKAVESNLDPVESVEEETED